MTMADPARVEAMNASPTHPKVRIKLQVSSNNFVAGEDVTGKMELECRADGFGGGGKALAMGKIGVEMIGTQELLSRDHSALSSFLHAMNVFQGSGLPPSNAVHPFAAMSDHIFSQPEDDPLPRDYFPARKGLTTFFFRFTIPPTSPASIDYKSIAKVKYSIRAFCQVLYRREIKLVTGHLDVNVVEAFDEDLISRKDIERTYFGENNKLWLRGRVPGGYLVSGFTGSLHLHIRNGSYQVVDDIEVSIVRQLHLQADEQPHISDVLVSRRYNSLEYSTPPLGEGALLLDFDIPKDSTGVRGGDRIGIGRHGKRSVVGALFDIRCIVKVVLRKFPDTQLEIPVVILHPAVVSEIPPSPYPYPFPHDGYPHHPHHHPHEHRHHHPHHHHHHHHSYPHSPPIPPHSPGSSTPTPILYPPNHVSIPAALEAASHEYQLAPWGDPYQIHQPPYWGPDNILDEEYQDLYNRYGTPSGHERKNEFPTEPAYDNEWNEPPDPTYWRRNLSPEHDNSIESNILTHDGYEHTYGLQAQAAQTALLENEFISEQGAIEEDRLRPLARRVSHHLRVGNITSGRGRSVSPPPVHGIGLGEKQTKIFGKVPTRKTESQIQPSPPHQPTHIEDSEPKSHTNLALTPKRALRPSHSFDGSPLSSSGRVRSGAILISRHTFDGVIPSYPQSPTSISPPPSIPLSPMRTPSILCPRPVLSPRTSFTQLRDSNENGNVVGGARSENVDLLERAAVQAEMMALKDKTLPATPAGGSEFSQVTLKGKQQTPGIQQNDDDEELDMAVLLEREGVKPLSHKQGEETHRIRGVGLGLDALEKRLMKDVGTRKVSGTASKKTCLKGKTTSTIRAGVFTLAGQPKPDLPLPPPSKTRSRIISMDFEGATPLEKKLLLAVGTRRGSHPPIKGVGSQNPGRSGENEDGNPFLVPPTQSAVGEKKDVEAEVRRLRRETPSRVREWLGTVDVNVDASVGGQQQAKVVLDSQSPPESPLVQELNRPPQPKARFKFNPLPLPETKYDIRSARGGRGGIVTTVAAIWAQQANSPATKQTSALNSAATPTTKKASPKNSNSPALINASPITGPKLPTLLSSPVPNVPSDAESQSTPSPGVYNKSPAQALLFTKPAKPMISSTATLIRPTQSARSIPNGAGSTTGAVRAFMPTISELENNRQKDDAKYPPTSTSEGEPVGKARLKELIKKYEAQVART